MPDTTGFSPLREDEAAEDVEEAHAAPAPPASQGQPRGIRRAGRPQAPPELLTVDGTAGLVGREAARKWSSQMMLAGGLGLPWLWGVVACYLWPVACGRAGDSALQRRARTAAALFAASFVALVAWATFFLAAGERVLGEETWSKLALTHNTFLREWSSALNQM